MPISDAVYLRPLPPAVSEEQVWTLARRFGNVSGVRVNASHLPVCAYAYMRAYAEAAAFVAAGPFEMDGYTVEAKPKVPPLPFVVYVRDLPYDLDEPELLDICLQYGQVRYVAIAFDSGGMPVGYAHVGFSRPEEVTAAIDGLDGLELRGSTLHAAHGQRRGRNE